MNILQQIKYGIDKLKELPFQLKYQQRKIIAFFIEHAIQSDYYRSSIASTHESDEIDEQMVASKDLILVRTKIFMYENGPFDEHKQLAFELHSKEKQDDLFFKAITYHRKHTNFFILNDLKDYIDTYISTYGKIEKLSEFYLKATIRNDIELANVLASYL